MDLHPVPTTHERLRSGPLGAALLLALACGTGCPGDDVSVDTESGDSSTGGETSEPTTTTPTIEPTTTTTTTTPTGGMDSTGGPACGDGVLDEGEDCDGTELGGADCASQGFLEGELACGDDCTFDTSACVDAVCGNGAVEGDEACDGEDLGGEDCISLGYDEGSIACNEDCTFDESMCVLWSCGNDVIEGKEVCDGADLAGEDCMTQGFGDGTLACAADCAALDTSGCFTCGDGMVEGAEMCDGADLAGEDCVSQGFDSGTLGCAMDCTFDTSACVQCGDGVISGSEECEAMDLAGATCNTLGFVGGGALGCGTTCQYDTSMCASTILLLGDDTTDPAEWDAYRNALTAAGRMWGEVNLDVSPFPTLLELQAYNAVIWFDEGTIAPGNAQAQIVTDWLTDGNERDLFLTGVDYLWDFENATAGSGEDNLYVALGMPYQGDFAGAAIPTLDGVAGDPITDAFVAPAGLTLSMNGSSNGDYINDMGPGIPAATYSGMDPGSGFYGLGHYDAGSYQVVWLGVSFHAGLTDAAQRDTLMLNILTYFGV